MEFLKRLRFAIQYLGAPPWDTGVSPPELLEFIQEVPPGRAIDLGCGTGTNAITLARNGWQVTGIDFIRTAIKTARRKASRGGLDIDFITGDVTDISAVQGAFDLVLDIGCFHTLSLAKRVVYLSNLDRLLNPGGSFLIYGWLDTGQDDSVGIREIDIALLNDKLEMVDQAIGTERGMQPSTWLRFIRHPDDLPRNNLSADERDI
jgi:ubiquinone/menaquinone biosynthesis C-methylase UbiE